MIVITTLENIQDIEEMLEFHSHLIAEGEVVKVKNYYFTKTYRKVNGRLINVILPIPKE